MKKPAISICTIIVSTNFVLAAAAQAGQKIESMANGACAANKIYQGASNYPQCMFQYHQIIATIAARCAATGITESTPQFGECIIGGAQTIKAQMDAQQLAQQQAIAQQQQAIAQQQAAEAAAAQTIQQRKQNCFFAKLGEASAPHVGAPVTFGGTMSYAISQCQ